MNHDSDAHSGTATATGSATGTGCVHGSSCAVCLCEFVVPSHDKKITEHVRGQRHRSAAQHAYRLLHHRAATEASLQFLATRGFNLGMLGYGATELEHLRAHGFDVEQADADAVFDSLDADRSGSLEYKELNEMLRKGVGSESGAFLLVKHWQQVWKSI